VNDYEESTDHRVPSGDLLYHSPADVTDGCFWTHPVTRLHDPYHLEVLGD
jgi:hypothetical protein